MTDRAVDIVIPTLGRPTLDRVLSALARSGRSLPGRVLVVDDRRPGASPLQIGAGARALAGRFEVLRSGGRGPAAARNVGWRAARTPWVACLDDDVIPAGGWCRDLLDDVCVADDAGASQGRLTVPSPLGRRATDRERGVRGLATAPWISANMAYRRRSLAAVGGFDERFPRAYREDADVALRLADAGWRVVRGRRRVAHPAWPAGPWTSVRAQAGNADDALMHALHGRGWRRRTGTRRGRFAAHVAITAMGLLALSGSRLGRLAWLAGTAELAWRRIAPGPRTPREVATMLVTSVAIPPAAVWHRLRGTLRAARLRRQPVPALVLLDRDGTLVVDVEANGDPARVVPMAGARAALDRLRAAGVRLAVVSNQAAVGDGRLSRAALDAVNARVEALLGPFDDWLLCTHPADAGCVCRKPRPGNVLDAMARFGVPPGRTAMIGDVGIDLDAAGAAGVRAILVPTPITRPEEIADAPEVAADLGAAADRLLGAR